MSRGGDMIRLSLELTDRAHVFHKGLAHLAFGIRVSCPFKVRKNLTSG